MDKGQEHNELVRHIAELEARARGLAEQNEALQRQSDELKRDAMTIACMMYGAEMAGLNRENARLVKDAVDILALKNLFDRANEWCIDTIYGDGWVSIREVMPEGELVVTGRGATLHDALMAAGLMKEDGK